MDRIYGLFLQAVRAAMQARQVDWGSEVTPDDLTRLLELSREHHVLPLVFEAVYTCPAAKDLDPGRYAMYRSVCVHSIMTQALKTEEFLELYAQWRQAGLKPLVVKGLICRNLYPQPDYRPSSDEDVLIPEDQFPACHEAMLAFGMETGENPDHFDQVYEIPYGKRGSPVYIELHKQLFAPESDAYADLNRFFEGAFERTVSETIQGRTVDTLGHTDHLFYLICHAFKHFLHSGFGIRQVCDIVLFANRYGKQVDWLQVLENCKQIRAEKFAAAIFQIGSKYLVFDPEQAAYPAAWQEIQVDEMPMLADLLSGGLYGDASMSRKHSSNITLDAVAAQKQGRKTKGALLTSVFPPVDKLTGRYPYLKKYPYLAPVAWADRLFHYATETKNTKNNHAADALKIGNQRVALLQEYDII